MKKTVWSIFRDLVNSKEVGTEITRQEILDEIERQLIEYGTFIETKGVKRARFFISYVGLCSQYGYGQILS